MQHSTKLGFVVLCGLTTLSCGLAVQGAESETAAGWEELSRLDRLAMIRSGVQVGSVSSYDRSGGNDDGFSGKFSFVRQEPEGLVLADLQGPGVITRLWTPTPSDDVLEFFIDGESKPRLEVGFRDLFLGKHPAFPRPLAGFGAGGFYSYVPIPYAQSCKVRMRAKKVQFYQINFASYPKDTQIDSFIHPLSGPSAELRDQACQIWASSGSDISRWVTPKGTTPRVERRQVTLAPSSTNLVYRAEKPGRIVGLRFSPASAVIGKGRDLTLCISFDGDQPAVLCPLGDFFGFAWGQPAMESLLAGTSDNTLYAYFPMPYDHDATVQIISDRTQPVSLAAELTLVDVPRGQNEGRFYAGWRRENPTQSGLPFTFLETTGAGHLIGCVLQSQGFESGKTLFFEGDDQTTIDGALVMHGTGSEDFFNGGWYDVPDRWEKRISFPLSGCLGYAKHLGRTGGYRFMLGDAFVYHSSLKHTIEHSGVSNNIPTDYAAVTYWYSARPPQPPITLSPVADRRVIDLKEVVFPAWWQIPIHAFCFDRASLIRRVEKIGQDEVRFLTLEASGSDWFGPPFISFACELPAAGIYEVYLNAMRGPGQGIVQLFQNEVPIGAAADLYAENRSRANRVLLGKVQMVEGRNNLMFKLVGKNEKATSLALDLVELICVQAP